MKKLNFELLYPSTININHSALHSALGTKPKQMAVNVAHTVAEHYQFIWSLFSQHMVWNG